MKNLNKKDLLYLGILILIFLGIVYITAGSTYLYGSNLDWISQHVTFPEYFRTLFYNTKEFFPDFALNIGGGQSIYNFAYYGLFNPLYWPSYILPKVPMATYVTTMSIGTVIASIILMYTFLKSKKYNSELSFLGALCLTCATCLSLHSHRHLMFIDYMPFMILGLFGVDKKLDNGKGWLLTISVFLMIMTSYYYAVTGIFVLVIYGIYKYLIKTKKVTIKSFFNVGIPFLMPIIIGILGSSILIIPILRNILSSREATGIAISLEEILLPSMNLQYIVYDAYGVGLTAIVLPAIIDFYQKKKENIFLGICLTLPVIFPLVNYILNGTIYISSKILIPFLPIYVLVVTEFINRLFNKEVDLKKLFFYSTISVILFIISNVNVIKLKCILLSIDLAVVFISILLMNKRDKKAYFVTPLIITCILSSLFVGTNDQLVLKLTYKNSYKEMQEVINYVTDKDNSFYRISNNEYVGDNPNRLYGNINYRTSTVYSSLSNQEYNKFYYEVMNNNIPHRNRALTSSTNNLLFLLFSNNKYVVGRNKPLHGYEKIYEKNGINVYRNNHTLPFAFATSNVMSYDDFEKLSPEQKEEALLHNIITNSKTSTDYVSYVQPIDVDFDKILNKRYIKKNADGSYTINVRNSEKISINLPEQYQNKIIFISFNMNVNQTCAIGDQSIKINNAKNKLTCKEWVYYNNNTNFAYTISEEDLTKLTVSIGKGVYNISDIRVYYLDYASIENIDKKVDKFFVDMNETKGDYIFGSIDVSKDGYFIMTVPYDDGFTIKVDGKKVTYEKVDSAFIGFKIEKGHHEIEVEYTSPLKNISLAFTQLALIIFCVVTYLESKRKF